MAFDLRVTVFDLMVVCVATVKGEKSKEIEQKQIIQLIKRPLVPASITTPR